MTSNFTKSHDTKRWLVFFAMIISVVAIPKSVAAQWTTNGTNINNTNSGNVGVGTTTPLFSFDVNGGVNGFRAKAATVSSADAIASFENTSGTQLMVRGNGSVGIGTANPVGLLNLVGLNAAFTFGTPGASDASSFTINVADSGSLTNGANGRHLLIKAGNSDNTAGKVGGDLTLNPGGPTAPATAYGRVLMATSGGNVGIGTSSPASKLHVIGDVLVSGNIAAKYQDLAEWVESSQQLAPGTVVILDSSNANQVIGSTGSYDTRVAGVISSTPGITLGEKGEDKVLVATTGRVKVRVSAKSAPIQIGDLLVTSDEPGRAMKSEAVNLGGVLIHRPGTLIGKALEPLGKGEGEILVLLSLQ